MSQNRTVFPGMPNDNENHGTMGMNSFDQYPSPSSPFQGGNAPSGTIFPGMENSNSSNPTRQFTPQSNNRHSGKPLVGFLYSVSNTGFGEYWPLYIGPNTIGTDPNCDIILDEGTISRNHAEIVVRILKNPEKIDASITDARSTNGTMVNGKSLSSSSFGTECRNGDIITVGENYELLLILIDSRALGLKPSPNFVKRKSQHSAQFQNYDENNQFPPFNDNGGNNNGKGRTIGMDGFSGGGTMY